MVSKKSLIMRENTNMRSTGLMTTLAMPMTPCSSTMKGAPKVEKSRGVTMPEGMVVTPSGMPATTAMRMPMRISPGTFRQ